jgi:hypothetical protein
LEFDFFGQLPSVQALTHNRRVIAKPSPIVQKVGQPKEHNKNPGLKKRFLENKNIIIMCNMKIAISSSDCGIDSEVVLLTTTKERNNKNNIIMCNMKIAISSSDCGIDSEVVLHPDFHQELNSRKNQVCK